MCPNLPAAKPDRCYCGDTVGCCAGTKLPPAALLPYAAPEVVAAGAEPLAASAATDVWALGVTALEVLTGARAWPAGTSCRALAAALAGATPLPWEAAAVQARLGPLRGPLLCCLQRDAARRPTAAQLAAVLAAAMPA